MSATRKPSKAEIAARDEAIDGAGGIAPPQAGAPGFEALVGQETTVQALRRALQRHRLPHALLLHGPVGVGKATCAGILAQAVNCPVGNFVDACGECASCRKVARGLHPDVLWVQPSGRYITIDQITYRRRSGRGASESGDDSDETRRKSRKKAEQEPIVSWVGYKPYEGQRRVVIIDDAHAMNVPSQNALLKTLEEPPPSALLVLVTANPGRLLPTIRSRCQTLRLQPLGTTLMRRNLEEAHSMSAEEARLRAALAPGSLGRAISLDLDEYAARRDVAESAVEDAYEGGAALLASAEALLGAGAGDRKVEQAASAMEAVRDVLRDLLVVANGSSRDLVINVDRIDDWSDWGGKLDPEAIVEALRAVQQADDRLRGPLPPNAKLTVEEALIGVGAALRNGARA
ncbi:MAG: DNA polymerase III subunit delta' [Acidobacteriota bacterium]